MIFPDLAFSCRPARARETLADRRHLDGPQRSARPGRPRCSKIYSSPDCSALGPLPRGTLGTDSYAALASAGRPAAPAMLRRLRGGTHVAAHPIADGAVAFVSPAVQGVNGDAQHLREIRKRQQSVTGLECHDHLLSRGSQFEAGSARRVSVATWCSRRGASSKRLGRTARPVADWRLKDLSREATAGGREEHEQQLNSHGQLGSNTRVWPGGGECSIRPPPCMEPKVGNPVLLLSPSSVRWLARPGAISVAHPSVPICPCSPPTSRIASWRPEVAAGRVGQHGRLGLQPALRLRDAAFLTRAPRVAAHRARRGAPRARC